MLTRTMLRENRLIQVPATLLTLGLMWLIPFLIHLVPSTGGTPFGARLLPIFYAPLLAVALFHPGVALLACLAMPFINFLSTGMPPFNMAILLSVELTVFSLLLWIARPRWPQLPLAPLAFILAKVVSLILLAVVPLLPSSPWEYFTQSILDGLPGLLVLLALHLAVIRWIPYER